MNAPYSYRVGMQIRIEQVDEHGHASYGFGGPMQLTEDITLEAGSFLEIAKVLGRFHDLAQEVRAGRDCPEPQDAR